MLEGGTLPGGVRYPPCPHAAGPYPYMSGGMVCMSSALQRIVAADTAFGDFLTVAKARAIPRACSMHLPCIYLLATCSSLASSRRLAMTTALAAGGHSSARPSRRRLTCGTTRWRAGVSNSSRLALMP